MKRWESHRAPQKNRGQLLRLDTETERTLFFDYFPMNLGRVGGYQIKVDLRDVRRPIAEKTLARVLNPHQLPAFAAIATEGAFTSNSRAYTGIYR